MRTTRQQYNLLKCLIIGISGLMAVPAMAQKKDVAPRERSLHYNDLWKQRQRAKEEQRAGEPGLITTLKRKEDKLKAQEQLLAEREQRLMNLRREIEERYRALERLQLATDGKLKTYNERIERLRKERVNKLVKVYSNMKADAAAEVLANMTDKDSEELAVLIIDGLKGRTAGKIMGAMEAKDAIRLSRKYARYRKFKKEAAAANN
jgi:flagellar motility protein MotE (MotC chaperone)